MATSAWSEPAVASTAEIGQTVSAWSLPASAWTVTNGYGLGYTGGYSTTIPVEFATAEPAVVAASYGFPAVTVDAEEAVEFCGVLLEMGAPT